MRRRIVIAALVVANLALAGTLWAFFGARADCCQEDGGGNPYCCEGCCLFIHDCDGDGDCEGA